MRVCFFVPKCTPDNSHGRYVIELASRLGRQQNVTVYTGAVASQLRAIVQCHYLPVPQRPAVARIVALWASSVALVTHGRFDIVHTQGADAPVGDVITAQFCNSAMKASVGEQPSIVRRINYAIGSAAERYCMAKPSTRAIIAISHGVKRDIQRHYGVDAQKLVVIPHGVDAERFHPQNRVRWRKAVRQRLGLDDEDFVIAFVGGDYRRKGLIPLLRAVERVDRKVRVLAVGTPNHSQLASEVARERLRDRLTLVDQTPEIAPYYAASDCFALPTRYDTFSLATLEAMATGLPAVVSRLAGVSERLTDGVDCLLLEDPEDADALAGHLRRLVGDRGLRTSLGAAARQTAERHSWDHVAEQTVIVYRQVLGSRA